MAEDITRALEARPALATRAGSLPIKISGCPNGCGQHAAAGIGLQGSLRKVGGRGVPQYFVYLGGGYGDGTASFGRLAAKVPARRVPEAIERLIELYDREKAEGESAPAFLGRAAAERIDDLLRDLTELTPETARPEDFTDLDGSVAGAADAA
jgi:sulfite reductase (NADPH) hemoprotein beta-component